MLRHLCPVLLLGLLGALLSGDAGQLVRLAAPSPWRAGIDSATVDPYRLAAVERRPDGWSSISMIP